MKVSAILLTALLATSAHATDCVDFLQRYPRLMERLELQAEDRRALIAPALERDKKFCDSLAGRREPALGMTWQQVKESSWGGPSEINTTHSKAGRHDQLVYRWSGLKTKYVYLENGVVTAIQD